ncbi:1-hydroxycarotenoid 3,4-desaturase CrtD [Methylibium sp.]|uniref:1-hydroxycarotenoid 3,4-desaturase CrtD n=1 Tax=Methylibium sp. TaxID=2067992 RepID=UPI0033424C26
MQSKRVVVVGAGIGGLACALELAHQGLEVVVVERGPAPGGKMREVGEHGARMDAGPTVFTMRWVFEELLDRVGERLADHLTLRPLTVLARHAWNADEQLDLYADVEHSAEAIGRFAGAAEARAYRAFCTRASRVYAALEGPFLRGSRPTPWGLVARAGLRGLPELARISPFSTLWDALGDHFRDPRLRQLFGRYATYCGASPFLAPATLMLVAHVEQDGVWSVDGGMHRVAVALAGLAQRRGARFHYDASVSDLLIRNGRACGVRLADGRQIDATAVVFNGDPGALAAGHLGDDAVRAVRPPMASARSLSALTWNLVARTQGFPLHRHTVFFSGDYRAEFDDLFTHARLPASPTVYVCAQDRGDADTDVAGERGAERLLCLVNAPPTADRRPLTAQEITRCEQKSFETLARCGLHVEPSPLQRVTTTPSDFERLFPGTGGALYGPASHGWTASFTRPGSRSRMPGLYLAGGGTHPGPGVPMAALSGRLAAASVLQDHAAVRGSTAWSRPAAMPGGMSTR